MSRVRCLVTGAGGFAGTWLCRHLVDRGHAVTGWVRRPPAEPVAAVAYRTVDLVDAAACRVAMAAWPPEWIFHLGATTWPAQCAADPAGARRVNVDGTAHVAQSAPATARLVVVSTVHVYGPPQRLPLTVGHPLHPRGVYAETKRQAERRARLVRPDAIVARAFHHTGPGQSERYALADWAGQLARGAKTLRTGDLSLRRDYTDVRDIVVAYALLAERAAPGTTINLCSGEAPTLRWMLDQLIGGEDVVVQVERERLRPGDVAELRGDTTAAEALGWRRQWALSDTLAALRASASQALSPRGRP